MPQSSLTPSRPAPPANVLNFPDQGQINLDGLSQEQINALRVKQAECMLDLEKKRNELRMDIGALDASMAAINARTQEASLAGHFSTAQHCHNSSLGRTEVIIGNTGKAASGRMSLGGAAQSGNPLLLVGIIIAAVALIVALVAR